MPKIAEERPVLYPQVEFNDCQGPDALTVQQCKDLLGWEELPSKEGAQFRDRNGTYVRCTKNVRNRPLYMSSVEVLIQELLNKRWEYNGEPIIIGEYGTVLNGQHSLISVPFAEQDRTGPEAEKWKKNWPGEITMEKVVIRGIKETDRVVNTMDTCKPRSIADVVYRSEFLLKLKEKDRRRAARMTDFAIRLLWHRTGAFLDAFAPRRTHAEALDFIARHPKLLKAVAHIMEEDVSKEAKDGTTTPPTISMWISPGYASGMMYMMGTSSSDGDAYRRANPSSEKKLKMDNWEKACDFWTLLADPQNQDFKNLRLVLAEMSSLTSGGGGQQEKIAVLATAWGCFLNDGEMTRANVMPKFTKDSAGVRQLRYTPTFGGIDQGNPSHGGTGLPTQDVTAANGESKDPDGRTNTTLPVDVVEQAKKEIAEKAAAAKAKKDKERLKKATEKDGTATEAQTKPKTEKGPKKAKETTPQPQLVDVEKAP